MPTSLTAAPHRKRLPPVMPVPRLTMQMHHSEDKYSLVFNGIQYSERKPVHETPPNIQLNCGPGKGILNDRFY